MVELSVNVQCKWTPPVEFRGIEWRYRKRIMPRQVVSYRYFCWRSVGLWKSWTLWFDSDINIKFLWSWKPKLIENDVFCDKFLLSRGGRWNFLASKWRRKSPPESRRLLPKRKIHSQMRKQRIWYHCGARKRFFSFSCKLLKQWPRPKRVELHAILACRRWKCRARVNCPKSCRRPVVSLSHATKSYRVNRPLGMCVEERVWLQ